MAILFTQFMFPNGERKPMPFEGADADTELLAEELRAAGWRFEIECHPGTQMVHADCCNEEGQLALILERNGPAVPPAIEAMIKQAWARWVALGKPRADNPAVFEDPETIRILDDPFHPEREPEGR